MVYPPSRVLRQMLWNSCFECSAFVLALDCGLSYSVCKQCIQSQFSKAVTTQYKIVPQFSDNQMIKIFAGLTCMIFCESAVRVQLLLKYILWNAKTAFLTVQIKFHHDWIRWMTDKRGSQQHFFHAKVSKKYNISGEKNKPWLLSCMNGFVIKHLFIYWFDAYFQHFSGNFLKQSSWNTSTRLPPSLKINFPK